MFHQVIGNPTKVWISIWHVAKIKPNLNPNPGPVPGDVADVKTLTSSGKMFS